MGLKKFDLNNANECLAKAWKFHWGLQIKSNHFYFEDIVIVGHIKLAQVVGGWVMYSLYQVADFVCFIIRDVNKGSYEFDCRYFSIADLIKRTYFS